MKYKIKATVYNDGRTVYTPMIKKHWWSRWIILRYANKLPPYGDCVYYCDLESARKTIEIYDSKLINHEYYIPYKED